MDELGRAVRTFAKAYAVAITLIGILAYAIARVASQNSIGVYQQLLLFIGVGFVFASILAWTGFANIYRYSPTLYFSSPSYRQTVMHGKIGEEGRDSDALARGISFGLALMVSALALASWVLGIVALAIAFGAVLYLSSLESTKSKSA